MQSVEVPKPLLHFPLLPWICTTFHSTTATNNFRCSFDNRGTRAKRTRRLVQATRRVPHKLLTEIELVAPLVPVGDGGTVYGCAGLSSGVLLGLGYHFRGVTEMVWFRHKLCCVFVTVSVSRYASFVSTDTHFTYERANYKIARNLGFLSCADVVLSCPSKANLVREARRRKPRISVAPRR